MYMASEDCKDEEDARYSSEIWSLGCVINRVFIQTITWDKKMNEEYLIRILRNRRKPNLSGVPAFLRDVLKECFYYNPTKRPSTGKLTLLIEKFLNYSKNITG